MPMSRAAKKPKKSRVATGVGSIGLVRHFFRQGHTVANLSYKYKVPKEDIQATLREEFKLKREYVHDWENKPARCTGCGTDKSTKYKIGDVRYCNLCILMT